MPRPGRWCPGDPGALEEELATVASTALQEPRSRLVDLGLIVEVDVFRGRPPQGLAELARSWHADLVVVGSRGLGPATSGLLGSVSAEVVDSAPCAVLVARAVAVHGIVFATDGSNCAEESERFLATLPIARQVPITVVSVAHVLRAWTTGIAPTLVDEVLRAQAEQEAGARRTHAGIAEAAATRLRARGIAATPQVHSGDPATEIIRSASAAEAEMIVLGSRGQTGLRRFVLGSVARKVLYRAPGSVLVVRAGTTSGSSDAS